MRGLARNRDYIIDPGRRMKLILKCGAIGFVVSFGIFALGFWINHTTVSIARELVAPIQLVSLVLCPPSVGLMAADSAPLGMLLITMFVLALANAGFYGLVGAVLFRVRQGS
jgi:hypothetical protein